MKREYYKWYSAHLEKEMELLVFGHSGAKVLFFPPRMGRFFDYENWHVIESLKEKLEKGLLQIYCVDSIDCETFYNTDAHPIKRVKRHLQYENYILKEVFPFMDKLNPNPHVISAGCSLGAYHAVNIAMRHPNLFCKVVGMSGRYDLTVSKGYYDDLFKDYHEACVCSIMPNKYLKNLEDQDLITDLDKLDIVLVVGEEDLFLESNTQLVNILEEKGVHYQFYKWNGEAHKAFFWRKMAQLYI